MFAPAPLGRRFQRCPTPLDSSKETLGALGVPRAPRWPRASELPPRPAPPPQDTKPRGTRESRDLPPAPAGPGTTFRPVGHKRPSCGPPGHSLKRRKRSAQSFRWPGLRGHGWGSGSPGRDGAAGAPAPGTGSALHGASGVREPLGFGVPAAPSAAADLCDGPPSPRRGRHVRVVRASS